jgi:hypothetical protein
MIERLQANPDILRFHFPTDAKEPANLGRSLGTPTNLTQSEAARIFERPARLAPYITY